MRKQKQYLKLFLFIITVTIVFNSCAVIKGLKYLNTKNIKLTEHEYKNKSVKFIEIHHAGRVEFYKKLKDTIKHYKQHGYTVFFEEVRPDAGIDSLKKDTIYRKLRKMFGGLPNRGFYSLLDSVSDFTSQPAIDSLNIDSTDVNADITISQLVAEYEKTKCKINLEKIDFEIPLKEEYDYKKMKGTNDIILTYRNQQLAKKVYSSKQNKILVIYGEAHRKGFFKELDKLYK